MTLVRRFLALVLALAVAAAATLVIVEAVGIRVGEGPVLLPIDEWEQRITSGAWSRWSADAWTIASAVALAVGLLLIVLQLIPHRTTTLDRRTAGHELEVRFGRSGLADRLHDVVVDQDGVLDSKVKVSKRKVDATARIPDGGDPTAAKHAVQSALREDLDRLKLAKNPKVRVGTAYTDDRVL